MKLRFLCSVLFFAPALLSGQDKGTGTPVPAYTELKQLLDIRSLQKQLPLNDAPYKTQAVSVLTADQKAKLSKLAEALQLQSAAGQAGMLLLIDTPVTGPPGILPVGLGTVDRGFLLTPAVAIAPRK